MCVRACARMCVCLGSRRWCTPRISLICVSMRNGMRPQRRACACVRRVSRSVQSQHVPKRLKLGLGRLRRQRRRLRRALSGRVLLVEMRNRFSVFSVTAGELKPRMCLIVSNVSEGCFIKESLKLLRDRLRRAGPRGRKTERERERIDTHSSTEHCN